MSDQVQGAGYSESKMEMDMSSLELKMDTTALKLEMDTTASASGQVVC
jgi:hypothetical protein